MKKGHRQRIAALQSAPEKARGQQAVEQGLRVDLVSAMT